ncbi:GTP-binding protein HSR1 [Pseudomonas sp. PB103]|nr:GTP-binding protein HSR1 [Pseudomonas sp. PB103]
MYRYDDIRTKLEQNELLMPLDVLLVGGTGTGKSSTLNALFGEVVAKVGYGVEPETQALSSHQVHQYLRFHDSAGLGDGKAADLNHAKSITEILNRSTQNQNQGFIDLVLVLLDGGSRDLGTTFSLLEKVILKSIDSDRVIVAINQADMAMKGRHWDFVTCRPESALLDFLNEKAKSIENRIKDSTGLNIQRPVFYSALHKYNLHAVIDHIYDHIPETVRMLN